MKSTLRTIISAVSTCGVSRTMFAILVSAAIGCGQGEPAETSAGNGAKTESLPEVASATPAEAIHELMMAYKSGDDAKAAALLTEKSRQEAERTGKSVSPPGSKTMQFKVGEVQHPGGAKDQAHVACQISEVAPDGERIESDVVWFLRKEPKGWRVAGIAMKPFPDELPVLYNFEDQDDMDRKLELVDIEMGKRELAKFEEAKATLMQAQQPNGDDSLKK